MSVRVGAGQQPLRIHKSRLRTLKGIRTGRDGENFRVLPVRLVQPLSRRRFRADDDAAVWFEDVAGQPPFDVVTEPIICDQARHLRTLQGLLRLPLRHQRPILRFPTPGGGVAEGMQNLARKLQALQAALSMRDELLDSIRDSDNSAVRKTHTARKVDCTVPDLACRRTFFLACLPIRVAADWAENRSSVNSPF